MTKKYKINLADAVEWCNSYKGELFHALLCDAPYHLTSITERFGGEDDSPAQYGTDGLFQRASKGFMGQTWDGGDVAFRKETWESFKKVLRPGAFGMTFGGSRTYHRIAVAIEDAGFVIHPFIFGWLYGSGFPKATNISKAIQKERRGWGGKAISNYNMENVPLSKRSQLLRHEKAFDGYRYGLQALKPALEPIIVFQKPYEGRSRDNIIETGAGALNIDGSRIPLEGGDEYEINTWDDNAHPFGNGAGNEYSSRKEEKGRWPSNFILSEETAPLLDSQSGIEKGGFVRNSTAGARFFNNNGSKTDYETDEVINEESGGASRFFFKVKEQLEESDPIFYVTKASGKERDAGLYEFEKTVGGSMKANTSENMQLGTSSLKGEPKPRELLRNPHPTVKPLELNRYLATLLLPPDLYAPRRIFVPFAGVASEMIGSLQAGFEYVEGVELTKEYIPIAEARLKFWENRPWWKELETPKEPVDGQMSIFDLLDKESPS